MESRIVNMIHVIWPRLPQPLKQSDAAQPSRGTVKMNGNAIKTEFCEYLNGKYERPTSSDDERDKKVVH